MSGRIGRFIIPISIRTLAEWHDRFATDRNSLATLLMAMYNIQSVNFRMQLDGVDFPHLEVRCRDESQKTQMRVYVSRLLGTIQQLTTAIANNQLEQVSLWSLPGSEEDVSERIRHFCLDLDPSLNVVAQRIIITYMRSGYGIRAVDEVHNPPNTQENSVPEGYVEGEDPAHRRNRDNQRADEETRRPNLPRRAEAPPQPEEPQPGLLPHGGFPDRADQEENRVPLKDITPKKKDPSAKKD